MKRHLVWLRADLRCHDNTALHAACADPADAVACVYAITPRQWQRHDTAGVRVDFELRTLRVLQADLAALNIPLLLLTVPDFAALPAALRRLAAAHGVSEVHANRQYEVNEIARDTAVAATLEKAGIPFRRYHDQCAVPPGTLRKQDGRAYSVFTPFKRSWLARLAETGVRPLPLPRPRPPFGIAADPVPDHVPGFTSHVDAKVALHWWPAGEDAALRRLQRFTTERLSHYREQRDLPAQPGSSRLSPYLAVGTLSPRQCLNAAFRHQVRHGSSTGSEQWIAEIAWRDFYRHVMAAWPQVCMHRPFRPETEGIPWRHDEGDFARWCEGRTGFPIVDAAMRQLAHTGWMHNRLRMIVAMFLTKDLFIDWRWGERFFMQHLIDGDLASNNGGWQWSASTGNDAAPHFRIFNPVSQSRKCDPEGRFIRHYLPELAGVEGDAVHAPYAKGQGLLFSDYPAPMVDHAEARERVLRHFLDKSPLAPEE